MIKKVKLLIPSPPLPTPKFPSLLFTVNFIPTFSIILSGVLVLFFFFFAFFPPISKSYSSLIILLPLSPFLYLVPYIPSMHQRLLRKQNKIKQYRKEKKRTEKASPPSLNLHTRCFLSFFLSFFLICTLTYFTSYSSLFLANFFIYIN